jgi:hypothetical protein
MVMSLTVVPDQSVKKENTMIKKWLESYVVAALAIILFLPVANAQFKGPGIYKMRQLNRKRKLTKIGINSRLTLIPSKLWQPKLNLKFNNCSPFQWLQKHSH